MQEKPTCLTIRHKKATCKLNAMLLPYGFYFNKSILELGVGQEMLTIDEPPQRVLVREKTIIPIRSKMANAISLLIYDIPVEDVFKAMWANWKGDIQRDNLIFLVYETIDD